MNRAVDYECTVRIEPIRDDLISYVEMRIFDLKDEEGFGIIDALSFESASFKFYASSVVEATQTLTKVLLDLSGIIESIGVEISRVEE